MYKIFEKWYIKLDITTPRDKIGTQTFYLMAKSSANVDPASRFFGAITVTITKDNEMDLLSKYTRTEGICKTKADINVDPTQLA